MKNDQQILIKPHHYLDIIKLYGSGLERFVPDEKFGHDFYRVGNIILENPDIEMKLTIGADDICRPCKFLQEEKCIGDAKNNPVFSSKQEWNETIDKRIMEILNLEEGSMFFSLEFCQLVRKKISKKDIEEIWREHPKELTKKRMNFLLKGINKYIDRYLI